MKITVTVPSDMQTKYFKFNDKNIKCLKDGILYYWNNFSIQWKEFTCVNYKTRTFYYTQITRKEAKQLFPQAFDTNAWAATFSPSFLAFAIFGMIKGKLSKHHGQTFTDFQIAIEIDNLIKQYGNA